MTCRVQREFLVVSALAVFSAAFLLATSENANAVTQDVALVCKTKSAGTFDRFHNGQLVSRETDIAGEEQISIKLTEDTCVVSNIGLPLKLTKTSMTATCLLDASGVIPQSYPWGKDYDIIEINRLDGSMVNKMILGAEGKVVKTGSIMTTYYQCEIRKPLF